MTKSFPDGIVSISASVAEDFKNETEIVIPEGVTRIEERAFMDFSSVERIVLPSSLCEIGSCAFFGTSPKHIFIPASVEVIGARAIPACRIYCEGEKGEGWYEKEVTYCGDYEYDFHRGGVSYTTVTVTWYCDCSDIRYNVSREEYETIR